MREVWKPFHVRKLEHHAGKERKQGMTRGMSSNVWKTRTLGWCRINRWTLKKIYFGFHASPGLLVLRSIPHHFPALCGGSADPCSLHLPGIFSATVYPLDLGTSDSGHISSMAPPAPTRWTHCGSSFSGSLLLLTSLASLSSVWLLSSSVTSVPSSLHYFWKYIN